MRTLRLVAIAIILAITSVAITKANINSNRSLTTFYYIGPANPSQQDLNTAGNYTSTPQGFNCSGSTLVCSILDNSSSGDPTVPALDKGTVTNTSGGAYSTTLRDL